MGTNSQLIFGRNILNQMFWSNVPLLLGPRLSVATLPPNPSPAAAGSFASGSAAPAGTSGRESVESCTGQKCGAGLWGRDVGVGLAGMVHRDFERTSCFQRNYE